MSEEDDLDRFSYQYKGCIRHHEGPFQSRGSSKLVYCVCQQCGFVWTEPAFGCIPHLTTVTNCPGCGSNMWHFPCPQCDLTPDPFDEDHVEDVG